MPACRICGAGTVSAGSRRGELSGRDFELRRCESCGFGFVAEPRTDYDAIYDDAYYAGCGVDPLVDYVYEFEHPLETVRRYEWHGIVTAVSALTSVGPDTAWLDYGCGTGGLVRHVRDAVGATGAVGFEEGWALPRLRERGVPVIERGEMEARAGGFDVITAIEVIEHVVDPLPVLRDIRRLLRPGGLFFLTTGNAGPRHGDLAGWSYVRPEIHVSFFEPRTLAEALRRTGFEPAFPGYGPGWPDLIRFKLLKHLA